MSQRIRQTVKTGAFAVLVLTGCIASAQAKLLASQGRWQVTGEIINNKPRCLIHNNDPAQYLGAFYSRGDDHISLQIGSRNWSLPPGEKYAYKGQFDQEGPWTADATSGLYADGSSYIDSDIKGDTIDRWLDELAHGHYLVVSFPEGKIRPWVLDLGGTHSVVETFVKCVKDLLNVPAYGRAR